MATPDGPQLQRLESHAYPSQHVGFLEAKQATALEEFKRLAEKKGYYRPAQGEKPASHDDETLLRYVRARRWNVQDAFGQFKDTEEWRKKNQIDKLYDCIDVAEYDVGRRLYPQWTGRRDKRGIPLYVFEVSHVTSKAVSAFEKASSKPGEVESDLPPKMLRLFALYENLCNFALPLCSLVPDRPYTQTPVSQSSNIVDISGVSLKRFWDLKNHMQDASTLATAHYPETLDRIFIIGAPSFFPTVWNWIKKWFDPITVSKIFIVSKAETLSTLEQFVDRANIPKKYGGDLDFTFGDLPMLDPVINSSLEWIEPELDGKENTFPSGPIRWSKLDNGDMLATAVGSVGGKQRHTKVAIFKQPSTTTKQSSTLAPPTLQRLPSGLDTHPPTPPANEIISERPESPSGSSTPASGFATSTLPSRPTPDSSNTISSNPTAVSEEDATSAPLGQKDSARSGTTETRYAQQASTHGHGQLSDATPETREASTGDKHGVMETKTVGQALKTHPVDEDLPEQPSYLEQAQNVAGAAVGAAGAVASSVAGMVGLGGKKTEPEEAKEESTELSPEVEGANKEQLEDFLRSKVVSTKKQEEV